MTVTVADMTGRGLSEGQSLPPGLVLATMLHPDQERHQPDLLTGTQCLPTGLKSA